MHYTCAVALICALTVYLLCMCKRLTCRDGLPHLMLFIAHESLENKVNLKIILLMSLSSGLMMHEHPVTYRSTVNRETILLM